MFVYKSVNCTSVQLPVARLDSDDGSAVRSELGSPLVDVCGDVFVSELRGSGQQWSGQSELKGGHRICSRAGTMAPQQRDKDPFEPPGKRFC